MQEVKRKLMSSLDLNIVVENLYTTADLIYVSQNALDGTVARQEISGLQIDLANLCGKSQVAMTEIHSNTANMLNVLPTVFNLLVLGKTTAAMKILSSGSQYAQNMANAANSLAGKVELMIDKATNALLKSEELYTCI